MPLRPSQQVRITLTVNGQSQDLDVPAERLLIDLLRDDLGLTGTKEGCSVGVCGACSVLIDGELHTACLTPAVTLDGRSVTTIEGIARADGELSPVQAAFVRHGGFQCGICTPGQVVAATALLGEEAAPDEAHIRHFMTGNLCRCTGYEGIVASITAAAAEIRASGDPVDVPEPGVEAVVS
jgi:carbon-monoxide dehydrogenase small subunit